MPRRNVGEVKKREKPILGKKLDLRSKTARRLKETLEAQLSRVVEHEHAIVSAGFEEKKRKPRHSQRTYHDEGRAPELLKDGIWEMDFVLTDELNSGRVPIRCEPHEPSAHVLKFRRLAVRTAKKIREAVGSTMHAWSAPFELPPSLEAFVSESQALRVESIDPRCFIDQFTPGDPDRAYKEQFHWFSLWRSPFIRWEVKGSVINTLDAQGSFHESETEMQRLVHDQFTHTHPDLAYEQAYAWYRRIWEAWKQWMHAVQDRWLVIKEEEEEMVTQVEQSWGVPILVPRLDKVRVVTGLLGFMLLVTIPAGAVTLSRSLKTSIQQIEKEGNAAFGHVTSGMQSTSLDSQDEWRRASQGFRSALDSLSHMNALAVALAQAIPGARESYQTVKVILQIGESASSAAELLMQGLEHAAHESVRHPIDRLAIFSTYLEQAIPQLDAAFADAERIKQNLLSKDLQIKIANMQHTVSAARMVLYDTEKALRLLEAALGKKESRRYLLIFQNHTELRPTGGFMGSFAEIVVDRGEIKQTMVPGGGPYDLRSQLTKRVKPPEPLRLMASRWEIQDANWFPDFAASAKKIRWFWQNSGQPTLDGVIAINASFMEKLLTLTGPIDVPAYGKRITAENFLSETQMAVEVEYDRKENKPKKFIGDLMPRVLERFKEDSAKRPMTYLELVVNALETKDIQVALVRSEEQSVGHELGWDGALSPSHGDALALIETNIGGQKTDAVIQETVTHDVMIDERGRITDTVIMVRTHGGERGELFRGANNVTYLRAYVPKGSELLDARGFKPPDHALFKPVLEQDEDDPEIAMTSQKSWQVFEEVSVSEEFGHTVFGGWLQLKPGETTTTTVRYRLPFSATQLITDNKQLTTDDQQETNSDMRRNLKAAYLFKGTSQSGKHTRTLTTNIHIPKAWSVLWSKGQKSVLWNHDTVFGELFGLPTHDAKNP